MPCPFPGMDPYIERPAIWGDFHDSLIFCIKAALQPVLWGRYAALTQERLYVVESEQPISTRFSIVRSTSTKPSSGGGAAVAEAATADDLSDDAAPEAEYVPGNAEDSTSKTPQQPESSPSGTADDADKSRAAAASAGSGSQATDSDR